MSKENAYLASLLDQKKEYMEHLADLLIEPMVMGFQRLYKKAGKRPDGRGGILKMFQDELEDVPAWNAVQIQDAYDEFVEKTGCNYLHELVRALLTTHMHIHATSVKLQSRKDAPAIRLRIPNAENFVHRAYVHAARLLWKKPYLLYHGVKSIEQQHNLLQMEELLRKAVQATVRSCLPLEQLIQQIEIPTTPLSDDEASNTDESSEPEEESDSEEDGSESEEDEYLEEVEITKGGEADDGPEEEESGEDGEITNDVAPFAESEEEEEKITNDVVPFAESEEEEEKITNDVVPLSEPEEEEEKITNDVAPLSEPEEEEEQLVVETEETIDIWEKEEPIGYGDDSGSESDLGGWAPPMASSPRQRRSLEIDEAPPQPDDLLEVSLAAPTVVPSEEVYTPPPPPATRRVPLSGLMVNPKKLRGLLRKDRERIREHDPDAFF